MKRRARILLGKSMDSLVLAIDHFNRPWDRGRHEAVLIFLDRAFELLLKGAIVEQGGRIRERRARQTIGFDKCIRKCLSDADLDVITEDQALNLQIVNSLRDAAQHYLLDIPEQQLYIYCQAGVTVYSEILEHVFGKSLKDYLPERVLPISTSPPSDLPTLIGAEFKEIRELVKPGSRKRVQARAKLRALAIVDSSLAGERSQPSDAALGRLVKQVQEGKPWSEMFPGVASLRLDVSGESPALSIRLTKKEGEAVRLVPEGTPGATVVAVRRVSELGYYSLGLHRLAEHVGLSWPRTYAVVAHLGIQEDEDLFKEFRIGKARYKRYSPKAIDVIKEALPDLDMDGIWRDHGFSRGRRAHQIEA